MTFVFLEKFKALFLKAEPSGTNGHGLGFAQLDVDSDPVDQISFTIDMIGLFDVDTPESIRDGAIKRKEDNQVVWQQRLWAMSSGIFGQPVSDTFYLDVVEANDSKSIFVFFCVSVSEHGY